MKLRDILLKVGSSVIESVVPGGGLILDLVNGFLPEDRKLPKGATGAEAVTAINSLPPEQQGALMEKKLDVEIAESNNWAAIQGSLSQADQTGNSTRPDIAIMMAQTVCFAIVSFVAIYCVAIILDRQAMIKQLNDSYLLIIALLATPTALLRAYFGMRTKEKQARYQAATGQPQPTNLLTNLIGAWRKR